jgi:hypothetical protein
MLHGMYMSIITRKANTLYICNKLMALGHTHYTSLFYFFRICSQNVTKYHFDNKYPFRFDNEIFLHCYVHLKRIKPSSPKYFFPYHNTLTEDNTINMHVCHINKCADTLLEIMLFIHTYKSLSFVPNC